MREQFEITSVVTIPEHLIGQIRAKLGYVDELIARAEISTAGDLITLTLHGAADDDHL